MPLEKDQVIWDQQPLINYPEARKAGLLGKIVCVPDSQGTYHPFQQDVEIVSRPKNEMEKLGPIDYVSLPAECPRFRKCDSCPRALGSTAVVVEAVVDIGRSQV